MPINYKEYHPKWRLISKLIRYRRAGNKCEWCDIKNGAEGYRDEKGVWQDWYVGVSFKDDAADLWAQKRVRLTRIVLTVAHIDHDNTNNHFSNLAALCQRCHLKHDLPQHIENRRYGRNWKKYQLRLPL